MLPRRPADCREGLQGGLYLLFSEPVGLIKVRKAPGLSERSLVGAELEGGHAGPPLRVNPGRR